MSDKIEVIDLAAIEREAVKLYGTEHGLASEEAAPAFDAVGWRVRSQYRKRVGKR